MRRSGGEGRRNWRGGCGSTAIERSRSRRRDRSPRSPRSTRGRGIADWRVGSRPWRVRTARPLGVQHLVFVNCDAEWIHKNLATSFLIRIIIPYDPKEKFDILKEYFKKRFQ